jgi:hypothetical protein
MERHSGEDRTDTDSEVGTLVEKMELEHHAEEQHTVAEIQCSLEPLGPQIGRYQNPYGLGGPLKGRQNHRGHRHRHRLDHHDHDCYY